MAKFSPQARLAPIEEKELLAEFFYYLAEMKSAAEIGNALQDLLTPQELQMIAKRLRIAVALLAGKTYAEIGQELKVSAPTISRLNQWLQKAGDGFRLLYERGQKFRSGTQQKGEWAEDWQRLRRRSTPEHWPELFVEQLLRHATSEQRRELLEVFRRLEQEKLMTVSLRRFRTMLESDLRTGN